MRTATRRTVGAGELQLQLSVVSLAKQQLRANLSAPSASVACRHQNAPTNLLVHKLRQRGAHHGQVSVHRRADVNDDAQQLLPCARAARQAAGHAQRVGTRARYGMRSTSRRDACIAHALRCALSRRLAARVRAPCRPAAASRWRVRRSGGSDAAARRLRQAAAQCSRTQPCGNKEAKNTQREGTGARIAAVSSRPFQPASQLASSSE